MCGFAGFLDPDHRTNPTHWPGLLTAMTDAIAPRGPNHAGQWHDAEAGIGLGFRRLSILDLSPAGNQPMTSADGRFQLVYNGEIYNAPDIKARLEQTGGIAWRGHSDTEILLAALARWGVAETLPMLDGMFAFALWDRETRTLFLARDRFGEKPLVYGWQQGVFLFGSTLAALRPHPAWETKLSATAVSAFLTRSYVPAPLTIQEGMAKLPPGHWGELRPGRDRTLALKTYFDPLEEAESLQPGGGTRPIEEAVDELDALIARSVTRRLHADVPVGVFLSGGIDSSTVAAHAARAAGHRVKTFTIAFPDSAHDEAPYARGVAAHLGTDHHEMPVTDKDARDLLPDLPATYDEPFADPSALPSMVLSRKTRAHVTVALSGDGGDEFFGGYGRYRAAAEDWRRAAGRPQWLRRAAGTLARVPGMPGRKALARAGIQGPDDAYLPHVSRWRWDMPTAAYDEPPWPASPLAPEARFMVQDTMTYLPDDLQVKMDRASMGTSLEVRAPLLDHAIARFAFAQFPEISTYPNISGKYLLRRTLARHVPEHLFERPKMGFYQPLPDWLRGELRDWAEALLSPLALARTGLIDPAPIRAAWAAHLRGRNRALDLWTILTFQQWLAAQSA